MSSPSPASAIAGSNFIWRVVDDEALILDLSTGVYFSLNAVATEVWQGLQAGQSLTQISSDIAQRYSISEDCARADVTGFFEDLRQAKLWNPQGAADEQPT